MKFFKSFISFNHLHRTPWTGVGRQTALLACIAAAGMAVFQAAAQGELINGGTQTGAVSAANEQDTWTFTAQEGDHLFLRVSQTTGGTGFAPRIRVFDSTNLLVGTASGAASSSTSSARLDYVAGSSGSFTLVVDAGSSRRHG